MMNDQEKEIMLIAAEECAEVTQMISKCMRFGLDAEWNQGYNRVRLAEEIGDLFCMVDLMTERGLVDRDVIYNASISKRERLKIWSNIFSDND
jgi:NTP pyrophosphatase (non-canonical NTP hydrolase)